MRPEFEKRRQDHIAALLGLLPLAMERIDWDAGRLERHRQLRLRALLRHAREHSPWHARRLASLDPESVTLADLQRIPPMTKGDLMANWDEIVTDPRLSLDRCERHLACLREPAYLLDEYQVVASGGSSGERGVFALGWDEWARAYATYMRWILRALSTLRTTLPPRPLAATVISGSPVHLGPAMAATFSSPQLEVRRFTVTTPLPQLTAGLDRVKPLLLLGYPSILHLLAAESEAGRLHISPALVATAAEPLLPEIAEAVEHAWGARLMDTYGLSEFCFAGSSCTQGQGLHLNDDVLLVEPVDARGQPVPVGAPAAKWYGTALGHTTLPLIRYEVTDEIRLTSGDCPCGSRFRRIAHVQGRLDDAFCYGDGRVVHPHAFRSVFARERHVVEYQVRQSLDGAEVLLRNSGPVDLRQLRDALSSSLRGFGLVEPRLEIRTVPAIPRTAAAEKLKRFVALNSGDPRSPVQRRHSGAPDCGSLSTAGGASVIRGDGS